MTTSNSYPRENRREVSLPESVVDRVEARLPRTDFETADEYVTFVLREVLTRVEESSDGESYDGVDEPEVKRRLESLGYLE